MRPNRPKTLDSKPKNKNKIHHQAIIYLAYHRTKFVRVSNHLIPNCKSKPPNHINGPALITNKPNWTHPLTYCAHNINCHPFTNRQLQPPKLVVHSPSQKTINQTISMTTILSDYSIYLFIWPCRCLAAVDHPSRRREC